jgi:hypothetical protein
MTLKELSRKYRHDREWIQGQIHRYEVEKSSPVPRPVTLVADATFFGKRSDRFGLLVAKDILSGQPVWYDFISSETTQVYAAMKRTLLAQGFDIQAITLDGRRGIRELFTEIPVQMCHFHQYAIITRYLTRNPKMPASIELKRIVSYLGKGSACRFDYLLDAWHKRHEAFIREKVEDDSKRGWHYKHRRLRSAYRSLKNNLPFLFTYRNHPGLSIPNTTNALDGGIFAPLKMLLKIHRGIGIDMKKKLISDYLENLMN